MKITMAEVRDIGEIVAAINEVTKDTGIVQATLEIRTHEERGVVLTFDEGDDDWAFEVLDYTEPIEEGDLEEDEVPASGDATTVINVTQIPSLAEEQAAVRQ